MKRLLLLAVFAGFSGIACAQDFDNYKTILPEGPVPKDFIELSAAKFQTEVTNITDKKKRVKQTKKKFVLESTFSIDGFLANGTVLFNDAITVYLQNVLEETLKFDPALQKKIKIYAVKSANVNAFTTNSGHIFVNLGLLARLENEAQLAFVLSHEVIHFKKQHVMNVYVKNIEIERGRGDYRKLNLNERDFAKSSFSKEMESEADLLGSDLYAASAYSKDSVAGIFDILNVADQPLMYTTFNKQPFEGGSYIFPEALVIERGKAVEILEDYNDSTLTHPNIKKRKERVTAKFANGRGGVDFKISKQRFQQIRKIARFELCRILLLEHRYAECIALAQSLQLEDPRSAFLRESIAKALYGLAKLRLRDEDARVLKESWGNEMERVATFLSKQSPYELSVLALRALQKCKEQAPASAELGLMVSDLMRSFAAEYAGVAKNFVKTANQKPLDKLAYPSYTQYAFVDLASSAEFFQQFEKQAAAAGKPKSSQSSRKKKSAKAKSLKVDKLVVVKPAYVKIDTRKKQRVRHVDAEEVLININDKINNAAGELGMKTEIINPNKLSMNQVDVMRANSVMNDWFDERILTADNEQISPVYNEVLALATTYKTDHFAWMGAFALRHKNAGKGYYIATGLLLPAFAPYMIAGMVKPSGKTLYFAMVFNVRTQELEMLDIRAMAMRDTDHLLQSNIYYTLFKLKK
ncbi:MAG TPA: M48 family metalloprotease [Chryseosolibacter sp.]